MFLGQYEHTIDEKGRMTIPARYRELLEEGAYIIQGFDSNLIVLTANIFSQVADRINHMSMTDPIARQLHRLIFSNACLVEFDRAGRILIPQPLRQAANLDGTAVVVGSGNYFEIWSKNLWQDQTTALQNSEANNQRFAAIDLSLH
jgi:MraZ protein